MHSGFYMVRPDVTFHGGCSCYRYCLNLIQKHVLAYRINNTIVEVHVNSGVLPWVMYLNVLCSCKCVLKKQISGTLMLLTFVVQ